MRNEAHFTRVSPAPGLTARVMARIAEHEHAQARRRALIGSALLVIVAIALLALVCLWLASWIAALVDRPDLFTSVLVALSPVALGLGTVLEALWVALTTVARNVESLQMLTYTLIVFALTLLWARIATGSFQRPFANGHVRTV